MSILRTIKRATTTFELDCVSPVYMCVCVCQLAEHILPIRPYATHHVIVHKLDGQESISSMDCNLPCNLECLGDCLDSNGRVLLENLCVQLCFLPLMLWI